MNIMNILYHCSLCGAKIIVDKESPALIQGPNCGYYYMRVSLSERIKRFFKQTILRLRFRKQIKKAKATDGIDKVIFLDFDGVLDNYYYCYQLRKQGLPERDNYGMIFDTSCVECLKYILDKTDAHIVITSSWKDFMTYEELLKMWHERKLPGTVFDTAPSMISKRGDEIDQWLKEFKRPCSYVILDDLDDSFFNPHQLEHFIQINPNRGIQMEDAKKAVEILNEQK